mmetsp:Transcript_23513/g.44323  ORF Transcript_23513/g.44323 Transcript_23513/m.44323 type:complete len:196 (-) Transcript_23513:133-720(-)
MGCSQSSSVTTAQDTGGAAYAHSFPTQDATKVAQAILADKRKQNEANNKELPKSRTKESIASANAEKLADFRKCVIQIGDSVEEECDEPKLEKDYDSWQHEVDAQDLKAMKSGHAVPVNRTAHLHLAKKMQTSLSELTEDPNKLKRAVQLRRMSREEITAYRNMLTLNTGDSSKEEGKSTKDERQKRRPDPKPSI